MTSSLGVREEKKPAWTEEEEEELRRLYEEHRHSDGKLELLVCSTVMSFWSYPWSRCVLSWLYSSRCCGNRADSAQQHRANPAAGGHSARAHGSGGKHQGAEETKVRSPRPGMNKCSDDFPALWFPLTEVFFIIIYFKGKELRLYCGRRNKRWSWRFSLRSSRTQMVNEKRPNKKDQKKTLR